MFRYFVGNGQTFVRASGEPSVQKNTCIDNETYLPLLPKGSRGEGNL